MAELTGVRGVKLPVTDVRKSLDWYQRVFGVQPWIEFPDDDGVVRGVGCHIPGCGQTMLALRENPDAHPMAGLELILAVADRAALEGWVAHLDACGVAHSPIIDATVGWLLVLHDHDGHEIHLYTDQRHGIDQTGRSGYGRPAGLVDGSD